MEEIVCPYLNETVSNVMSFNQTDLYKVEQPGTYVIWNVKSNTIKSDQIKSNTGYAVFWDFGKITV